MNNFDKILNDNLIKCHYPFFWLCGGESVETVVKAVERVHASGCDGFTVEPREFQDFDKHWWVLMDAILKRAKELGMKVLIVDEDSFCPSGHAFGAVNLPENEHLRRTSLLEVHVDVIGPRKMDAVIGIPAMWNKTKYKDELIGAYAFKRTDKDNGIDVSNPIDLNPFVKSGILSWDVPEGNYRIEYLYKTRRYSEMNKDDYIDVLSADAVDLLIHNTYDEYERRYKEYFGNTLIGFFSDEPFIGNSYVYGGMGNGAHEDTMIGKWDRTLPFNDGIKAALDARYGGDSTPYMPSLWYWDEKISPKFRGDYMDIVSKLYSECFAQRIGKWCKDRGLIYIGHVLEDNNLHTRLGDGPAHYFRSQQGQTMPGIDIVLHQILPGFYDYNCGGYSAYLYDSEFYHYILGKLNSSAAHTYPEFNKKAMCEVTIGYGWAEGSQLAKWLFDYLLVRGTNFFVPGAVRPEFPDIMHAPHFGDNQGREPQFDGYVKILDYSRKVLSAFENSDHVANALILYNGYGEWMSASDYMLMQRPAKVLYDNHIDFDILSEDLVDKIKVKDGKCSLIENYDCIVVPYAKYLPEQLLSAFTRLKENGADIVFVDALPEGCTTAFNVVPLSQVADYFKAKNYTDISIENFSALRHYHATVSGADAYMFFNESATETFDGVIKTGKKGNYNVYDFIANDYSCGNDDIKIRLEPYQSVIVVYEKDRGFKPYVNLNELKVENVSLQSHVKLYYYDKPDTVFDEFSQNEFKAISERYPNFSGKIEYTFKVNAVKRDVQYLKFESVGENARVTVNGVDCGLIVCNPFAFDVSKAMVDGENIVKVEVYTTLANAIKDPVSMFVPLARTGLSGNISLLYK